MLDPDLPVWRFDPGSGTWEASPDPREPRPVREITLVTYNVWFAGFAFQERCEAMLRLLRETDADVIALQEVTEEFLARAIREEWLRESYAISDATGKTVRGYGAVLFSRLPVRRMSLHELPTCMRRHALIAELRAGPLDLAVCTAHLESLRESASYREMQLREIFALLEKHGNAALLGDLNFCSSWDENELLDDRYVDLWPMLRPDEAGHTEDPDRNPMRRKGKAAVRFDRILLRCAPGALKAREIRLLGTEPISRDRPDVFPSDHFGLRAVLVTRKIS